MATFIGPPLAVVALASGGPMEAMVTSSRNRHAL